MIALSTERVAAWHDALRPKHLSYLQRERGLSERTVRRFRIGWDGTRYTIPIYDADGALINVRRYDPGAANSKMLSLKGHGKGKRIAFLDRLPAVLPTRGRAACVVLCAGEWDAIVLQNHGWNAVTSTGGESAVPNAEDLQRLAGLPVAVMYDSDPAGRAGAAKVCAALLPIASAVKDVVLPLPKDPTDWFVRHKQSSKSLLDLVRETPILGSRRDEAGLLRVAEERATQGEARNAAGFWLACQLRDERYTVEEAAVVMADYQVAVSGLKSSPYDRDEADNSLRQAFSRPPRRAVGATGVGGYRLTDVGNAERLVDRHGDDLRWVEEWRRWVVWDGQRWSPRGNIVVEGWAKETARSVLAEAAQIADEDDRKPYLAHAARSESAPKVRAMLEMARSEPGVSVQPDAFDRDPWLLVCPNGTVDLRTGQLREHARADMCRRMTTVPLVPNAEAPRWHAFLRRVLPDPEVRAFVQRAVGYSLTGSTAEQKLLLLYGYGANGKTTFCEAVKEVVGEYGQQMPFETLLEKRNPGIPNDVARLDGSRFVLASESKDGDRFNEQLVKQLTGGDTMTARFLHAEYFDFRPQCTVWLRTNHRPVVRGTDDAIWRRFLMVPFEVQIPEAERDDDLPDKLRAELPGVLRWAVEGALAWQREGLNPPQAVLAATEEYRSESDVLGSFLDECVTFDASERITGADLHDAYKRWCRVSELVAMSRVSFSRKMKERGLQECRIGETSARGWAGLTLRPSADANGQVFFLAEKRRADHQ